MTKKSPARETVMRQGNQYPPAGTGPVMPFGISLGEGCARIQTPSAGASASRTIGGGGFAKATAEVAESRRFEAAGSSLDWLS